MNCKTCKELLAKVALASLNPEPNHCNQIWDVFNAGRQYAACCGKLVPQETPESRRVLGPDEILQEGDEVWHDEEFVRKILATTQYRIDWEGKPASQIICNYPTCRVIRPGKKV